MNESGNATVLDHSGGSDHLRDRTFRSGLHGGAPLKPLMQNGMRFLLILAVGWGALLLTVWLISKCLGVPGL